VNLEVTVLLRFEREALAARGRQVFLETVALVADRRRERPEVGKATVSNAVAMFVVAGGWCG
jgi:hypothetical protein